MKEIKGINLQLFAEEEEIDEEEVEEIEELEVEPAETPQEELEKPKSDKVTNALIEQKRSNKELKSKLAEYDQKEKERELSGKKKEIADKLIEKGYDEDEALKMAENNTKVESLEREIKMLRYERQAEKLEVKYPDVTDNLERLIDICSKTGWTLEKVCAAEFGVNEYDSKIKSEQETLIARKKTGQSTPVPIQTPTQSIKLEPDDEKAYQFYAKENPGVSRKQYRDNVLNANNQKIPDGKWD